MLIPLEHKSTLISLFFFLIKYLYGVSTLKVKIANFIHQQMLGGKVYSQACKYTRRRKKNKENINRIQNSDKKVLDISSILYLKIKEKKWMRRAVIYLLTVLKHC